MDTLLKLISEQIEIIENLTGCDVLLNDQYSFLSKTKLTELKSYNLYHINSYCLIVKNNRQIRLQCRNFKHRLFDKVRNEKKVIKSICFCGVAEYIAPIIVNDLFFGTISVSGFKGELLPRQVKNLSKRINIPYEKFKDVRNETLVKNHNEKLLMYQVEILAYLIQNFVKKDIELSNINIKENQVNNTYVINALDYIQTNFSKNISVADVAKASFVSASYLQSLFSKFVGRSVSEEIILRRIQNAKELLCTTDYSVKYIAFECGFESAEYFSVAFKKACGITPLKFRKTHSKL